jgi:glycosyltransferase involved in cell wall biosynthesis
MPKVSILLPVHGDAPFLPTTLENIEKQTFSDWELILSLDRTESSTSNLLETLRSRDPRVRLVLSTKPGISQALNAGTSVASGEYLARIDADDWMDSERLANQVAFLDQNPDVVCLGSKTQIVDEKSRQIGVSMLPTSRAQVRRMMPTFNVVSHPSTIIRASALREVGGYDPRFNGAEDYHLWLKLLRVGEITNLREPLTSYRVHPGQSSRESIDTQGLLECAVRLDVEGLALPDFEGTVLAEIKRVGASRFWHDVVMLEKGATLFQRSSLAFSRLLGRAIRESGFTKIRFMLSAFLVNPARYIEISARVWFLRLANLKWK